VLLLLTVSKTFIKSFINNDVFIIYIVLYYTNRKEKRNKVVIYLF
jgi:hypothetical protein